MGQGRASQILDLPEREEAIISQGQLSVLLIAIRDLVGGGIGGGL